MDNRAESLIAARSLADLLTLSRGLVALALIWLGLDQGFEALPAAVYLLIYSWTSDSLDGTIARRSRAASTSWIGEHDLEFDMSVAGGLLVFLLAADLVHPSVGGLYVLTWLLVFWRWGNVRSLGMLSQAPVYGWFIWSAVRDAPAAGQWLLIWIVAAIIITWPRFPRVIVPDFLRGMGSIRRKYRGPNDL